MPWGEVAEDFRETPAYSQLFLELVSSSENLANFLKQAIPAETAQKIAEAEAAKAAEAEKANSEKAVEAPDNITELPVNSGEPDAP